MRFGVTASDKPRPDDQCQHQRRDRELRRPCLLRGHPGQAQGAPNRGHCRQCEGTDLEAFEVEQCGADEGEPRVVAEHENTQGNRGQYGQGCGAEGAPVPPGRERKGNQYAKMGLYAGETDQQSRPPWAIAQQQQPATDQAAADEPRLAVHHVEENRRRCERERPGERPGQDAPHCQEIWQGGQPQPTAPREKVRQVR